MQSNVFGHRRRNGIPEHFSAMDVICSKMLCWTTWQNDCQTNRWRSTLVPVAMHLCCIWQPWRVSIDKGQRIVHQAEEGNGTSADDAGSRKCNKSSKTSQREQRAQQRNVNVLHFGVIALECSDEDGGYSNESGVDYTATQFIIRRTMVVCQKHSCWHGKYSHEVLGMQTSTSPEEATMSQ